MRTRVRCHIAFPNATQIRCSGEKKFWENEKIPQKLPLKEKNEQTFRLFFFFNSIYTSVSLLVVLRGVFAFFMFLYLALLLLVVFVLDKHFVSTHSRTSEGRYIPRLPFKTGSTIDISKSQLPQCMLKWTDCNLILRSASNIMIFFTNISSSVTWRP